MLYQGEMKKRERDHGFVYIGIVPSDQGFFVKVGSTNHPERRAMKYATHCPGGLQGMYASRCKSRAAAFAQENILRSFVRGQAGTSKAGGEWTHVPRDCLERIFTAMERGIGEVFQIDASSWASAPARVLWN